MTRFYVGKIVVARFNDGEGKLKSRPAIVLSLTDYSKHQEMLLVPISSVRQRGGVPYYHVQVHHDNHRDPITKLDCPSWAKCNWATWLPRGRIANPKFGDLPDALLDRVARAFDHLQNDSDFDDWVSGL